MGEPSSDLYRTYKMAEPSRATLIRISKLFYRTLKYSVSLCYKLILALSRPISMREGVFELLNDHTLPTKSIACLRLEIRLQIKKLWSKWWFYTISKQSFCNSVTSKLWKNILEKWVLGGLQKVSGWFYIDMWQLKPYFVKHLELTYSQTAKIPFEILPIVTVWHLGSLLEFFLFRTRCWYLVHTACIYMLQSHV